MYKHFIHYTFFWKFEVFQLVVNIEIGWGTPEETVYTIGKSNSADRFCVRNVGFVTILLFFFPVWLRNRIISAKFKPVISNTEKIMYCRQFWYPRLAVFNTMNNYFTLFRLKSWSDCPFVIPSTMRHVKHFYN